MGKKRIITKAEAVKETADQKSADLAVKKSQKRQVLKGIASIFSSYNNTIVSIADTKGEVIAWSSAGSLGFKGARKSTPYAATQVARDVLEKAKKYGLSEISIAVRGIGPGREAAIRGLAGTGLNINALVDNTPLPHNGVRPPKPRRV
ncbi:MAG: 30S ribosomal protein S11 [Candidatus Yanofskybacteria bacterium]|nr:30S ribosomal protein S11 [Candidatus Yanofskybacteria bacterium]